MDLFEAKKFIDCNHTVESTQFDLRSLKAEVISLHVQKNIPIRKKIMKYTETENFIIYFMFNLLFGIALLGV